MTWPVAGRTSIWGSTRPGGADDLFDDFAAGEPQFDTCPAWRRRRAPGSTWREFLEMHGAVVQGGGQAEAVIDEDFLAVAVAGVHGVDLRDGDVGFVDDEQVVLGEIIDEGVGLGAGRRPAMWRE